MFMQKAVVENWMELISESLNGKGPLDAAALKRLSNRLRFSAMSMTNHAGLGHTGGDLSSADILATLYFGGVLRINAADPRWEQRDRFIMSKGHCSGMFY